MNNSKPYSILAELLRDCKPDECEMDVVVHDAEDFEMGNCSGITSM
jgi:hypothetical protein